MPAEAASEQQKTDFINGLHSFVHQRTGGRIKRLQICCSGRMLVLRGVSYTYYGKQLAQAALMSLVDEYQIFNEIIVEPIPLLHFRK